GGRGALHAGHRGPPSVAESPAPRPPAGRVAVPGRRRSSTAGRPLDLLSGRAAGRGIPNVVPDPPPPDPPFQSRMVRLNALVTGVTTGLTAGFALFLVTNWLVLKGGRVVGPHLALLGQFLVGYRVTFVGSLVGSVDVFVLGFVTGFGVARLYNWLADWRARPGAGDA